MPRRIITFITLSLLISGLTGFSTRTANAQSNAPQTSGEGDQIIQDIAAGTGGMPVVGGVGFDSPPIGPVVLPETGGVTLDTYNHRHSPPTQYQRVATQNTNLLEQAIAASAATVGMMLLVVGAFFRHRHRQERRARYR